MKKYWFHIALLACIILPIVMLAYLDYSNLEGYNYQFNRDTNSFQPWNNTFFDQNFTFDLTWKGRMFYPIFAWLLIIESTLGWRQIVDKKPQNRVLMGLSLAVAIIPTIYVLATNFFGLDLTLLKMGFISGTPSVTASNEPSDFLHLSWPLSLEYLVFFTSFFFAVLLAYKPKSLKIFSISLALLGAVGSAYMLDTIYPFGVFRPLQEMALPTAATAAAVFDILGYNVTMSYPMHTAGSLLPALTVSTGDKATGLAIAWACAGVFSLLLYVLIIFIFFRRTNISGFRKLLYFIIGLFGAFFTNVLRICAIILINLQSGHDAGMQFHNTYGELFGFGWIFGFILLIVCIERFTLVERVKSSFQTVSAHLRRKSNPLPIIETKTGTQVH